MEREIVKILRKISSAKWITLLLIAVPLAIFVWINFDFLTEVSFTLKKDEQTSIAEPEQNNDKVGTPKLSLGDIILPPSPASLPSIVVFEVKNPGNAATNNVRINIDYGAAKVIGYEILGPNAADVTGSEAGLSILNIDIKQIKPHESAYIYAQTNIPTFKKITISSENTTSVRNLTLKEYAETNESGMGPDFYDFLQIIFGTFILVMSLFFTYVLIQKLSDWLNVRGF